jgi:hypothetical protein
VAPAFFSHFVSHYTLRKVASGFARQTFVPPAKRRKIAATNVLSGITSYSALGIRELEHVPPNAVYGLSVVCTWTAASKTVSVYTVAFALR